VASRVHNLVQNVVTEFRPERWNGDKVNSHAENLLQTALQVSELPPDRRGELDQQIYITVFCLLAARVRAEYAYATHVELSPQCGQVLVKQSFDLLP
jgi:hypothetical protein